MTNHSHPCCDDKMPADGVVAWSLIALAVMFDLAAGAFVYKVWNERQMTHEYHAQAVEQKRIADVMKFFVDEARAARGGKP